MLYEKYRRLLYHRAYRVVKQEPLAEEIVQDVFIAIWQNRDNNEVNMENLEGYIFGILKHKTFDALRKVVQDRIFAYIDAEIEHDPVNDWYDAKEMRELLNAVIAKMPNKQQEVFRLIKIDGFKREEVARKLGISPHTVKNHLLAATIFLKENLDLLLLTYVALNFSEKIFTIH